MKTIENCGAGEERAAIVRWLRYNSDHILGKATIHSENHPFWEGISLAVDLVADMIEEGAHNEADD